MTSAASTQPWEMQNEQGRAVVNEVVNICPSKEENCYSVSGDLRHMEKNCRFSNVSEKQKSKFFFPCEIS